MYCQRTLFVAAPLILVSMSYGWLTESSFVPKPGKAIRHVSANSLAALRTLVVESEETSKRRIEATGTKHTKPTKKFRSRTERLLDGTNKDVEKRRKLDTSKTSDPAVGSPVDVYEATRKKLEEKAKLYDALVSGSIEPEDVVDSVGVPGNSRTFKGKERSLCLDVKKKREEVVVSQSASTDNGPLIETGKDAEKELSLSQNSTPPAPTLKDQLRRRLEQLRDARAAGRDDG